MATTATGTGRPAGRRWLFEVVGTGHEVDRVNCHHNFTQRERHLGRNLWITRKGAIKAQVGDRGVIPGSMGTRSYDRAVELLDEHPASYKDIDTVMAAQADLVTVEAVLHQVFNYKGHK